MLEIPCCLRSPFWNYMLLFRALVVSFINKRFPCFDVLRIDSPRTNLFARVFFQLRATITLSTVEEILCDCTKRINPADETTDLQTENQICLVMVGLPARGKSLIAGKGLFLCSLIYQQSSLTSSPQSNGTLAGFPFEPKFSMLASTADKLHHIQMQNSLI